MAQVAGGLGPEVLPKWLLSRGPRGLLSVFAVLRITPLGGRGGVLFVLAAQDLVLVRVVLPCLWVWSLLHRGAAASGLLQTVGVCVAMRL